MSKQKSLLPIIYDIETCQTTVTDSYKIDFGNDLKGWLEKEAANHQFTYLLGYALDGVIWGHFDKSLVTAYAVANVQLEGGATDGVVKMARRVSAELRANTLQEARVFGESAELYLWRQGNEWVARLIRDEGESADAHFVECINDFQMLWGTQRTQLNPTFYLWEDGQQGLRHALPTSLLIKKNGKDKPPRLKIRHYLANTNDARIATSRLVGFTTEES